MSDEFQVEECSGFFYGFSYLNNFDKYKKTENGGFDYFKYQRFTDLHKFFMLFIYMADCLHDLESLFMFEDQY